MKIKKEIRKFIIVGALLLLVVTGGVFFSVGVTQLTIDIDNVKEIYVNYRGAEGPVEHIVPKEQWELLKTELERLKLVRRDNIKDYWCYFVFQYEDGTQKKITLCDEIVIVIDRHKGGWDTYDYRPLNFDSANFEIFLGDS